MAELFCFMTVPPWAGYLFFAPNFIVWNENFYILRELSFLGFFSLISLLPFILPFFLFLFFFLPFLSATFFSSSPSSLTFLEQKGHRRIEGTRLSVCLFASCDALSPSGSTVGSGCFSLFPSLGTQLAVEGGRFFPCFQINCTCGLARLHAGFGFGSALRSHSQLLNPLQTTGQMIAFGDSESFISLLFLTYLESRNHMRKPIISKWVFWFFRVKRAQKEGEKWRRRRRKAP